MRRRPQVLLVSASLLSLVVLLPLPARALSYTAGGGIAASWAGGWPTVDLRGRVGFVLSDGHEIGISGGLSSVMLASQILYLAHYSHTWATGRLWPIVSIYGGGASDFSGFLGQTRALLGLAFGARLPLGEHIALRLEVSHERLMGPLSADRSAITVGLEYLAVPGWTPRRAPERPAP